MMDLQTSGDRASWLCAVATEIMDTPIPVSSDELCRIVPRVVTTAVNDGHCTAANVLGEARRDDFQEGQRIIVGEMLSILVEGGLVRRADDQFEWAQDFDGEWIVGLGSSEVTIRGRRERRAARDRHIIGERSENGAEIDYVPGLVDLRQARAFEVDVLGPKGGTKRQSFEVHPLALLIPPMTALEREALKADIERNGVRTPLRLYPDARDLDLRTGAPKIKVLDGRNRLYLASVVGKPVRTELFEGTEDEARYLVASLNLHRRHLTSAQRNLAALKLFGEQAKRETLGHGGRPRKMPGKCQELTGEWSERAAKKAGGEAAGVTSEGVRNIAIVLDAPATHAKVLSGEIKTVADAHRKAKAELGEDSTPKPGRDGARPLSVGRRLTMARQHLRAILGDPEMEKGANSPEKIAECLDEIDVLTRRVREMLRERGIIPEGENVRPG